MKQTPFHARHAGLGAKLVEFGGFEMPVQYRGIIEEHLGVRQKVGVFDVSHMGEFEVSGPDAAAFVQRMTVNDVTKLSEGKVQYSAMCYDDGGIVDDLLVYHLGDRYMLVVNAANIHKDLAWLQLHLNGNVSLKDKSDETSLLAVQGPLSLATLRKIADIDLSGVPYYAFVRGSVAGVPMVISRTGYTGELGFEMYGPADTAVCHKVWDAVFDAGKEFGIQPVGLGARDTLRLEMGFCLYGNDIDQTTHPLEAGLGWITKLNKGDFAGRSAIADAKERGLKRKLVGFTLPDRSLARHGYSLAYRGRPVGQVTSGSYSPSLQKGIGMGYVEVGAAQPGTEITVGIRGNDVAATVVATPFVTRR